ncbi:MAG TPA: ester cyclase [Planctomycetota bacterium]|jgi:predicted ester cyclase
MSEANKALVRKYYEAVTGDLSKVDALLTAGFVDHHFPPGLPPGPAGVKQFFTNMGSVFSNMKIEHQFMLAEGSKVDCHFVFTAKQTGPFGEIPAKGNAIRLPAIATFRIEGNKLAEAWEIFDSGTLFGQMKA